VDHHNKRPLAQAGEVNPHAIISGKGVVHPSFDGQEGWWLGTVQNGGGCQRHEYGKQAHDGTITAPAAFACGFGILSNGWEGVLRPDRSTNANRHDSVCSLCFAADRPSEVHLKYGFFSPRST
jgi:hypothetical protein